MGEERWVRWDKGGRRRRPQGGGCAQGREVGAQRGGGGAGGGGLIPTAHAPRGAYAVRRRTAVWAGIRVWPPGCR